MLTGLGRGRDLQAQEAERAWWFQEQEAGGVGKKWRFSSPILSHRRIFPRREVRQITHSAIFENTPPSRKASQHTYEGKVGGWTSTDPQPICPSFSLCTLICSLHLPDLISLPRDSTSLTSQTNNLLLFLACSFSNFSRQPLQPHVAKI